VDQKVIFIDGDCSLCSRFVRLVIKFDKNNIYKFYPFDNSNGELNTIVLLENEKLYSKSKAVFSVLQNINLLFFLVGKLTSILPITFSNWVYDLVAANRNSLFGSYCIPIPREKRIEKSAIPDDLFNLAKRKSLGNE
tara:strand:- start:130 stop:540 length:411 start_codon:yes stop_codon:yes gene_type:complete